jgi:hypothetical protein
VRVLVNDAAKEVLIPIAKLVDERTPWCNRTFISSIAGKEHVEEAE